jgi:large subunit ribosomal protein L17
VRVEKGGTTTRVDLVEKVLLDLARRYATRSGGYTRVVKFGPRRGDNAPISLIELVTEPEEGEGQKKSGAKAMAASPKTATAAEPKEAAKVE